MAVQNFQIELLFPVAFSVARDRVTTTLDAPILTKYFLYSPNIFVGTLHKPRRQLLQLVLAKITHWPVPKAVKNQNKDYWKRIRSYVLYYMNKPSILLITWRVELREMSEDGDDIAASGIHLPTPLRTLRVTIISINKYWALSEFYKHRGAGLTPNQ